MKICGLSFFLLILTALPQPANAQDFTINRFHSDISIHEDASFVVRETIAAEFHRQRHGIYREIPFRYRDDLGSTITTPLKVLAVKDGAGKEWKYKTSRQGDVVNIKIGDAKKYVSGVQTYIITYSVENAIFFFPGHDELYWNVTGNYWKAPIKEASATIALVSKTSSSNLRGGCYTGVYGSRESKCGFKTYDGTGEFISLKKLNVGEGFTIAFGWDKGIVKPPSSWKRFLWAINVRENWVFIFPLISLITIIGLWHRRGRDPKVKEAVMVMYDPPKHEGKFLTPAEVGAIVDEKLDPRDITSTIVGLGVKGYIKIEERIKEGLIFDSTDYYLKRAKGPDDNLSRFETLLMGKIFSGSSEGIAVSEMKNKFYKNIQPLKDAIYKELESKRYFLKSPEKVRGAYIAGGIFVIILTTFLLVILSPYSADKGILAGILSGLPLFIFSKAMPAKTKAGSLAYMEILGFREFLNRAEKDRLVRMADKSLFSKFLPYAIALKVEDNWARAFEGIYQEQPDWYVSSSGITTFNPYGFSRSMDSMTSSLSSAMFSAPRGSGSSGGGSSGGGSSGGGFGGGGGGSW
ncbi:MAG: DUF2207 domain-containing protein [Nitrospirae bacterium]|nr:DUF2207 domain-containing protein [Nitrospirota bacterium]